MKSVSKNPVNLSILLIMSIMVLTGCTEIPNDIREEAKKGKGKACESVFNSSTSFCYDGNVYSKCDGMEYNPTTHICQGNVANPAKCNGVAYNPVEQGCCVSTKYNLANQRCLSNIVETKCGTGWYSSPSQRCENNVIEIRCGSGWYNETNGNMRCQNNVLETRCGIGGYYDATNANLRCQNNIVEAKCGTAWYNAANNNLRCQNNVVETRCGMSGSLWYDATDVNLRCQLITNTNTCDDCPYFSDYYAVETKCGTGWYNAARTNLRCQNNVVETLCGTTWYNAANTNLRCQSNIVEAKRGMTWYDVTNTNLRCQNDVIEIKCGTAWYDNSISTMEYCSDGILKTYKTVTIGEQTWMAENLNYYAEDSKCYSNDPVNCATYGRLYNWATAMALPVSCNDTPCTSQISSKHKGICPYGWHIPSMAEWDVLRNFLGSEAAKHLKSKEGWNACGPSDSGKSYLCEDTYGFAALPGGIGLSHSVSYSDVGNHGRWWAASEIDYRAVAIFMNDESEFVGFFNLGTYKIDLLSVRCVKD